MYQKKIYISLNTAPTFKFQVSAMNWTRCLVLKFTLPVTSYLWVCTNNCFLEKALYVHMYIYLCKYILLHFWCWTDLPKEPEPETIQHSKILVIFSTYKITGKIFFLLALSTFPSSLLSKLHSYYVHCTYTPVKSLYY